MKYQACVTLIIFTLTWMAGCDRSTSQTYALKGIVRKMDQATGEVTISHDEIVGFMPKMTMPFEVTNRGLLEGIKPGDEVEGTLRVDREGDSVTTLDLITIKVVKPASKSPEVANPMISSQPDPLQPGDLVPDFSMTTQTGETLKLADLRGKVVVLSFIYTRCPSPEFCPAMDAKFGELARRIGTVADRVDRVRLLSVSFDPEHDTPAVLSAHAARRGAKPPLWTFAVTSHEELSKIAGPLGLTYVPGTREIDHNLRAAVIGPDGRLVTVEIGAKWTPADLVKTILGRLSRTENE
jgi:protein SCO1/2